MASIKGTLADPLYRNWVKAGLALKFTRNGIEDFVKNEGKKFQQKVLSDTWRVNGLPAGTVCTTCADSDVVKRGWRCPANICHEIRDRVETSHRYKPNWKNTNIQRWGTNDWELAKAYMSDGYNYVSSAAETDFSGLVNVVINHKEFQNCVAENLSNNTNIFTEVRTVRNTILHSSTFQVTDSELITYIGAMILILSDAKYLVTDRHAQNAILKLTQIQNGSLSVTEDDESRILAEALKAIEERKVEAVDAVDDKKEEAIKCVDDKKEEAIKCVDDKKEEAIKGVDDKKVEAIKCVDDKKEEAIKGVDDKKVEAIKGVDDKKEEAIKGVLDKKVEAIKGVDDKKVEAIKGVDDKKEEAIKGVLDKKVEAIKGVDDKKEEAIKGVDDKKVEAIKCVDDKKVEAIKGVDDKKVEAIKYFDDKKEEAIKGVDDKKEEAIKGVDNKTVEALKRVEDKKDEAIKCVQKIKDNQDTEFKQAYLKEKQNLQKDLITIYKESCLKTPIHPLMDEVDEIANLFVTPCMKRVNHQQRSMGENPTIDTYQEILNKDSFSSRNIYITADAGKGKSTLCLWMVDKWCRAHSEHEEDETMSEEEQTMLRYDFLFFISLRSAREESNVEEMIKKQLLHHEGSQKLFLKLLEDRSIQCLIILDGLDEWVPPKHYKTSRFVSKGLPGRKLTTNCTYLTTSRPWKLEVLRPKTSEIDQHIEITGLDETSSGKLIDSVVTVLNKKYGGNRSADELKHELKDKQLDEFRMIPITLKHLICMWHEGKALGGSVCDIYSGMVDLLLELADGRLEDDQNFTSVKEKWSEEHIYLPNCFNGKEKCVQFSPLLLSLGRMAYETLFNTENRESELVFDSSVAELYGLSKAEIEICLKVGILCQCKVIGGCMSRLKSLSFLHKSFQEFLAAFFVSVSYDNSNKLVEHILSKCCSVEMVLDLGKVFAFISGMIPRVARRLSEHMCYMASSDSRVQKYRQDANRDFFIFFQNNEALTKQIQDTIVNCTKESTNTKLKLEDFFLEDTNSHLLKNLMSDNINNIKSLNCKAISSQSYNLREVLIQVHALQKLSIHDDTIDSDTLYSMVRKSQSTLQSLTIDKNVPHLLDEPVFIKLCSLYNLVSLSLRQIHLLHDQAEQLMSFLAQRTKMRNIGLDNITCRDHGGDCSYQLDLSQHTQLEVLELCGLHLDKVAINPTHLVACSIGGLYKPGVAASILKCVIGAPKLQSFVYITCTDTEDIDTLVLSVPTLVQVKYICLININIRDRKLKLSPKMRNLEYVFLYDVTITSQSLQGFVDSIPHTHQSVAVVLKGSTILPAENSRILDYIRTSPRFIVTKDTKKTFKFDTKVTTQTD